MFYDPCARRLLLVVLFFGLSIPRAFAAFAVCNSGWDWASNSRAENPCEIAGSLEADCQGFAVYYLGPIPQGASYLSPQRNSSSLKCECNTVMYSLIMACTACQNATAQSWTDWQEFCPSVYIGYPQTIPLNAAVPNWAYLDYGTLGHFDPVAAKSAGDTPERLAPVPSTISGPSSSSTTSTTQPAPSGTSSTSRSPIILSLASPACRVYLILSTGASPVNGQQNSDQGKSPSNVGAIAGGVIGGLAFLAIVGFLALVLRRRRASKGAISYSRPDDIEHPSTSTARPSGTRPPEMRLYDPSDPFTYPDQADYGFSNTGTAVSPPNKPRYSGAAEL